jgi:hypothetical protein
VSRNDRSGRGADKVLALTQVHPSGVLETTEDAHHPRLTEDAAAAEHEHVR